MLNCLRRLLKRPAARQPAARRAVVEELEPRILYSADANPMLWAGQGPQAAAIVGSIDTGDSTALAVQGADAQQQQQRRREIVFVDAAVPDAQKLIDGIFAGRSADAQIEVVQIHSGSDGVAQISDVLAQEQDLAAIHIVSHGSDGAIDIGSTRLDAERLAVDADAVTRWGRALTADGDLLLYGCDVARTATGRAFVQQLAQLTGADVAASADLTGSVVIGGNWTLEFATGTIHTSLTPSSFERLDWTGVLATYTVTSTADTNAPGTLRWAIEQANSSVGVLDTIAFNIGGGGAQTINVNGTSGANPNGTGLDYIVDAVIIDATTQPGYAGTPLITLNGASATGTTAGLVLRTSDSTIKGFIVINFNDEGIEIDGSTGAGDRNIFENNWVGITAAGAAAGNADNGIMISEDADNNIVRNNVVGSNGNNGIFIRNAGSDNNWVYGNIVGLAADASTVRANVGHGIYLSGDASNNFIGSNNDGSNDASEGNIVSGNAMAGIAIQTNGGGNAILLNSVYGNALLGIDLGTTGVTANDLGDVDTGANGLQNFPVLTSAVTTGAQLNVTGTLNSLANNYFRVEFFSSTSADPSGNGEGQTYLGFVNVTTDGSGNATINTALTANVATGRVISATATRSNAGFTTFTDTSEFAANVVATNTAPTISNGATVTLSSTNENTVSSSTSVNTILTGASWADADSGAQKGIAITSKAGNGSWQYSTDGVTWNGFGAVSTTSALLLTSTTQVRYLPDSLNGETATFSFVAWDQTSGTASTNSTRGLANPGTGGGTTAYSSQSATASMTVTSVNDAPTATDRALVFDGTDVVVVSSQPSLVMTSTTTIEAMVQRTGALSGGQLIVNKEGEYEVGISATGKLQWAFANTTPGWTFVQTAFTVPADTWVHVAITYNNGSVKTYVNGNLVDTYNGTGSIGDVYTAMNDLTIGGRENTTAQRFVGLIDEVRVWNVERSGAQVLAAYNTVLAGSESGLVGYWRFSETSGTVATDSSTQGNHGVLGNGVPADEPTRTTQLSYTVAEDATLTVSALDLLDRATDPEGSALMAVLISGPANASSFTLNANGTFSYTPTANFNGVDSFVFSASDGSVDSPPVTVYLTVTPVNDAPQATNLSAGQTYTEDTPLALTAIVISDVDSANVTATLTLSNPGAGSLNTGTSGAVTSIYNAGTGVWSASGAIANVNALLASLAFTPALNYNSNFTVATSVSDGVAAPVTGSKAMTGTVVADTPSVTPASTNEDTQSTSGLVISRNAADGAEVSHFKITGIANGTLYQNDGTTVIADGSFITFAQGNAGLKFTPAANFSGSASFTVQASTSSSNPGLGGSTVNATITVAAIADTPSVTPASTNEDTQSTSGLVISRNAADGAEVSHFKITGIANGTLYQNDGTTVIADGSFITFAQGNAGLKFTPAANFSGSASFTVQASTSSSNPGLGGSTVNATITVAAIADTPSVTPASTNEDTQSTSGLVISRNAADGAEVSHFKITGIANGTLYQNDGTTVIADGSFITFAQGNAGLKFTPAANFSGSASFTVQASTSSSNPGLGGSTVNATITVAAIADTPSVTPASTNEDTQSTSGLVISRNAADGAEVSHFKITGIANGTLYQNDGTTVIADGSFITFAQGNAGLKFTPAANFSGSASFTVQASTSSSNPGLGGSTVNATITVAAIADTPSVTPASTNEDTQSTSGLVISRNAADGAEVSHFKITGIANGTLYQNDGTTVIADGSFITFAQGNAGLKFTPAANFSGSASFTVQASTSSSNPGLGGSTVNATITVNAVNDAPVFIALDGAPTFSEGGSPVVLDSNVGVNDAELSLANNFNGASLTLLRNGGANAQDVFSATGTLSALTEGGTLVVGGTTIGSVTTNSGGTLLLTFGASATNALVDAALQQIAYSNSSAAPPTGVQIDWSFSDGNSGGQGIGGARSAFGSTMVTITGVNDPPIASNGAASTGENTTLNASVPAATDVDGTIAGYALVSSVGAGNGSLTFNPDGSYSFDPGIDFDSLAAGATRDVSFTYTATDNDGAVSAPATITITVTGTDDATVISGPSTASLTETNAAQSTGATLVATDPDSSNAFVAQNGVAGSNGYGSFSIDAAGVWTYTMNTAQDEFVAGVTYTESITVATVDGTTQLITVSMLGTNDAAALSADTRNLTETNFAADISSSGTLTISDVDSPATFVAQTSTGGSYGNFTIDAAGAWTYTASSAHDEFVAGTTYTDTFNVTSADGTTTTVTINILGTNDAALLSSDNSNLTEGNTAAAISSSGSLTISDVDSPATFVAQTGAAGTYGSFTIDAAGAWTYTASSAHDAFQAGVTYADTFNVTSADGTTTTVTINILGTNDAPVITSNGGGSAASVNVAENQTAVTTVRASDVEGNTLQYRLMGGADAAHFSINEVSGALRFISAPDFEAPRDADRNNLYDLVVGVSDGRGGTAVQTIAVAVSNVNEAPGNVAPSAVTLNERTAAGTLVATVTASDPDAGDVLSFSLVSDGNGRFLIDPSSGRLLVAPGAVLEYGTSPTHTLLLRVTDAHGLSTEQAILITLNNMAEPTVDTVPPEIVVPPAPAPEPAPASRTEALLIDRRLVADRDAAASGDDASAGSRVGDALAEDARDGRAAPPKARQSRDGGSLHVASVSLDGWPAAGLGDTSLDGLLIQQPIDGLRFSLASLRGSSLETEEFDGASPPVPRGASQAVQAALQDPVRVASATLTAGFVWWLTRSGGLLTSILMGIPAWRHVDLLPVLASRPDDEDDEHGDSDGRDEDASRHHPMNAQDSLTDDLFSNNSRLFGESRFLQ